MCTFTGVSIKKLLLLLLLLIKIIINNTLFDAQNAGSCISELLIFEFFRGSVPPDLSCGKGCFSPLWFHSHPFYLQQSLLRKPIETPPFKGQVGVNTKNILFFLPSVSSSFPMYLQSQWQPFIGIIDFIVSTAILLAPVVQGDGRTIQWINYSQSTGYLHFTVVCLAAWPFSENKAGGDLALIETLMLFLWLVLIINYYWY